jgi:hypothetical protein
MGACLIKHTELMGLSKDVFLPSSPFSDPLSIVREKETTMKHVSLSKIKPSALIKIPGLLILGLLAVAFLLFPLAAFAGCGGQQQAPKATLKIASVEPIFGPNCGGAAASKNATVTGNPTTTTTTTTTTANPVTPSLLAGISNCRFVVVKPGQKVVLQNGDIVVSTISQADKSGKAGSVGDVILGIVIGGQFRAINGDGNGGHAVGIVQSKKINFVLDNGGVQNGTTDKGSSTAGIDPTPND